MALNVFKRRPIRLTLIVLAACCAIVALAVGVRVQRALKLAARQRVSESRTPFKIFRLEPGRHAASFEPVPAATSYTSGAELNGELYLAGPEGLSILAADGLVRARFRTGIELPVAQIMAVTTGRLKGASEPQVVLATAGAGVLVVAPGGQIIQQMLPTSAQAADVSALQVLPSGNLLLGTRQAGVFVYSGTTLEPLEIHGADHVQVTSLAALNAASVLVGTHNQGVFYLHGGTTEHASTAEGLPDSQVESLIISGSKAYVGTPLGVAEFALAGSDFRPLRTLLPGVFAHALEVEGSGGELLVGTLDQGVRHVSLGGAAHLHEASIELGGPLQGGRVDSLIGAYALVDGKLQGRALGITQETRSMTDRNVSALAFDDRGSLFVGYFDRGLDILANGGVTHFEDDSLFCVNRLALDPRRKTIAAATANGLVLFDAQGAPRQTLTRRDGLISEHVTDVAFTRAGTVLATPAGLTFVNASGMESLYAFQGLVNNHVYALAADPATDRVLAGTLGGLSLLDREQVGRNLTVANSGLKHNWITALAQDGPGQWLVGTYGAGVMRMADDGTFATIDLPAGVPHDLVINPNALLVTATHVYAGTLGHGMLIYTRATGRWSSVTAGLPSWNVTAFAEHNGELYVGTDNGLMHVAEAAL